MTLALSYLKANRTRYKNLLEKELATGKILLQEDKDEIDIKESSRQISACIKRLTDFCEKLDTTNEKISLAVTLGSDEKDNIEELINGDCNLMSSAVDCRDQLVVRQESIQEEKTVSEISSTATLTEERVTRLEQQLQVQMQQLMIGNHGNAIQQQRQQSPHATVNLPRLEIPTFNGDRLKWTGFWDTFETTIDRNDSLSGIDKLKYLNSKLTGEAKHVISGIILSNDNYQVAVTLLKERFGDIQAVINAHYAELISLTPATNNPKSLRSLFDQIERNLRSLQALRQDIDQDIFVSIITSKIPKDVLIQLEIQKGAKTKWTVAKLRELFNDYIAARERADQQSYSGFGETKYNLPRPSRETAEALVSGTRTSPRSNNRRWSLPPCRYCNGSHWSDECLKYATVESRKQRIRGCCILCLKQGHRTSECGVSKTCFYCKELNSHHRSLCPQKFGMGLRESVQITDEIQEEGAVGGSERENALVSYGEMVLMQTAKTHIRNPINGSKESVRLLLDSGSQRTYITEALARTLNLQMGEVSEITLVTFGSDKPKTIRTPTTVLDIELRDGSILKITANVVPNITGSIQRRPVNLKTLENWGYLWKESNLADTLPHEKESSTIELLIGNDYYLDLILPRKIEIQRGLYMLGSKLGWILAGRTSDSFKETTEPSLLILTYGSEIRKETSLFTEADKSLPLKPNLEDFWRLESIGIQDYSESCDKVVLQTFQDTLRYENGRYMVTWPWKGEKSDLPDNYMLALGRLNSLIKRMKTSPNMIEQYNEIIDEQLKRGIIEKVNCETNNMVKHYIPHHPVINPTKATTKMRIVYDASAKTKHGNKSLNECLYRGPVMLQDLTGILLRFRLHKIALVSDIEKAFLQVGLSNAAKDVTRFLWLKNMDTLNTENNIQVYRFCRVPFGIISSPFLLAATLEHHFSQYDCATAKKIRENVYVDNVITGTDSVNDATTFYKESKQIFKNASMNLRDWMSNNEQVLKEIPKTDRSNEEKIKVLGLSWYAKDDQFSITFNNITNTQSCLTKRAVLKQIASVYDPMGLYSPVILRGKLFLQTLWNQNFSWDDKLTLQHVQEWDSIKSDLNELKGCRFPRFIGFDSKCETVYRLMTFCDASQYAYAAAVYLHQEYKHSRKADLLFSKTRLVPNKKISIPRLELLAALIGTRCMTYIAKELKLPVIQKTIWLDSQCVLGWIESKKSLATFVENRVKEIKSHQDITFSYISTKENPADIASRGLSTKDLQINKLWWNGPDWILKPCNEWPVWKYNKQNRDLITELEAEYKKTSVMFEAKLVAEEGNSCSPFGLDVNRFSSLTKLLRVTALADKFVAKLRKDAKANDPLDAADIEKAEKRWIEYVQKQYYDIVIDAIMKNKSNNLKSQLGIYLDTTGLLRCRGRLQNADICEGARQPLLLPKQHRYTDLVIERYHRSQLHTGTAQTLASLRHKFWIPHGRSVVKKVLARCSMCRRYEGGPYKMPLMSPFPIERVTEAVPFTFTGIDYCGPLFIKSKPETSKVWICLFTCLVTRAVHLELIHNMTTEHFLLGLRRFLASRGKPHEIISDNAGQFKLASMTIRKMWGQILTHHDVVSYVANENINWKFIVELAPWMGGFYERLIGLLKRSLRKTIGKLRLSNEQLLTVLKETEAVLNSRPLVYIGDDIHSTIALTPAYFLTLNPKVGIPDCEQFDVADQDYNPEMSSAEKLLLKWKKGLKILNLFWKTWRDDYLLSLRERTQWKMKESRIKSKFSPSPGDIVLIKDDLPRGKWRIGRLHELIISRDGEVRSAKILLPSKKLICRPLNLLFPIECPAEEPQSIEDTGIDDNTDQYDEHKSTTRPRRVAADKALLRLRQQLTDY